MGKKITVPKTMNQVKNYLHEAIDKRLEDFPAHRISLQNRQEYTRMFNGINDALAALEYQSVLGCSVEETFYVVKSALENGTYDRANVLEHLIVHLNQGGELRRNSRSDPCDFSDGSDAKSCVFSPDFGDKSSCTLTAYTTSIGYSRAQKVLRCSLTNPILKVTKYFVFPEEFTEKYLTESSGRKLGFVAGTLLKSTYPKMGGIGWDKIKQYEVADIYQMATMRWSKAGRLVYNWSKAA